jgi:hypothetical protein
LVPKNSSVARNWAMCASISSSPSVMAISGLPWSSQAAKAFTSPTVGSAMKGMFSTRDFGPGARAAMSSPITTPAWVRR